MAAQLGFKVTQVKIRKMVLFKAMQSDATEKMIMRRLILKGEGGG